MSARKTTTRLAKRKPDTEGLLSHQEVEHLAEWLANELEYDSKRVARFLLLVDHLESLVDNPTMFNLAASSIKQRLFAGTTESGVAQQRFEAQAHQERGKLLKWPQSA